MKLRLDIFEGPLDLLLYLIKKNNLEISKVSLATVTEQYLEYLETMKELNVDLVSEFLYMASELIHIKSKVLLPEDEKSEDDDEENADELIERLKTYQKFKALAQKLGERKQLHRDVFPARSFLMSEMADLKSEEDDEPKEKREVDFSKMDVDPYELVRAFHEVLKRLPQDKAEHHVQTERVSVTERIYQVLDRFKSSPSVLFEDLFENDETKIDHIVTFLAILEMSKLSLVRIYQTETFGSIRIQRHIDQESEQMTASLFSDDAVTYR